MYYRESRRSWRRLRRAKRRIEDIVTPAVNVFSLLLLGAFYVVDEAKKLIKKPTE
jgi:hypothetical protein